MSTETMTAPEEMTEQTEAEQVDQAAETDPVEVEQPADAPADAQAEPPADGEAIATVPEIRMLSLWQPWASLIAWGDKTIETRSWSHNYRGPVAIHATGPIKPAGRHAAEQHTPIVDALARHGVTVDQLPLGAVIAVADLVDVVEFTADYDPGETERHFGDFAAGRYGLKLNNVRVLKTPVECPGQRGLNACPMELAAQIWDRLANPDGAMAEAEAGAPPTDAAPAPVAPEMKPTLMPEPTIDDYRRILLSIEEQADHVVELRNAWESAKEIAAARKKAYDVATEELTDLIGRTKPESAPLFNQQPKVTGTPSTQQPSTPATETEAPAAEQAPAPDPDAWKAEPLSALKLPETLAAKLAELKEHGDAVTVGDIAAWAANRFEPALKGVGDAKRQMVSEALETFHMARAQVPASDADAPAADASAEGEPAAPDPETDGDRIRAAFAAANRDDYGHVLITDVLTGNGADPDTFAAVTEVVTDGHGIRTLGQLCDALAGGDGIGTAFRDLLDGEATALAEAVLHWLTVAVDPGADEQPADLEPAQPPVNLPADTPAGLNPTVHGLSYVGLKADQVKAAYYPHLLNGLQLNTAPECKHLVKPFRGEAPFIAVAPPAGVPGDYWLLPVIPKGDTANGFPDDGSPFTGGLITHQGAKLVIGPASAGVLVEV